MIEDRASLIRLARAPSRMDRGGQGQTDQCAHIRGACGLGTEYGHARLAEGIEWTVFGHFRLFSKEACDAANDGPAFAVPLILNIVRMVKENNVAMADISGEVPPGLMRPGSL